MTKLMILRNFERLCAYFVLLAILPVVFVHTSTGCVGPLELSRLQGKWMHFEGCSTTRQIVAHLTALVGGCERVAIKNSTYSAVKADYCTKDPLWSIEKCDLFRRLSRGARLGFLSM